MHGSSSIITLTYSEQNLPPDGELTHEDFQDFMRSLRYKAGPLRYFMVGEYGDKGPGHHPHFHAILFGEGFPDRYYWKTTDAGTVQYRSEALESNWKLGHSSLGDFTWKGAAYCARYVTKKIYGDAAEDHYQGLQPEYIKMSKGRSKPGGIGAQWFINNHRDVFPADKVRCNGRFYSVPRYYDKIYEEKYPKAMEKIKAKRQEASQEFLKNDPKEKNFKQRPEDVREECLAARTRSLNRSYENA